MVSAEAVQYLEVQYRVVAEVESQYLEVQCRVVAAEAVLCPDSPCRVAAAEAGLCPDWPCRVELEGVRLNLRFRKFRLSCPWRRGLKRILKSSLRIE